MDLNDRRTLIRRYFETYKTSDRDTLERLLSADFRFTSPHDDHIDRATYFDRCWAANAGTFEGHDLQLILVDGDDAVVHYDGRSKSGAAFRNIERLRFAGDQIRSIEVFFGLPDGSEATLPEDAIRTVLEQRSAALQVGDVRLVAAKHAADAVAFSMAPPLAVVGDGQAALEAWEKLWQHPLEWETRDPKIAVSGDVAFVHALEHMCGTKVDGQVVDLWFRTTLGLRKQDGSWKITHEHQSVPFYGEDLRAATDLQPDDYEFKPREMPGIAVYN